MLESLKCKTITVGKIKWNKVKSSCQFVMMKTLRNCDEMEMETISRHITSSIRLFHHLNESLEVSIIIRMNFSVFKSDSSSFSWKLRPCSTQPLLSVLDSGRSMCFINSLLF